jgi:hypothetical protein
MTTPSNRDRAGWAEAALAAFIEEAGVNGERETAHGVWFWHSSTARGATQSRSGFGSVTDVAGESSRRQILI